MQIGQTVKLYDRKTGKIVDAIIDALVGAGPSAAKILDLSVGDDEVTGIRHINDSGGVDQFWTLATMSEPEGWNDPTPVKVADPVVTDAPGDIITKGEKVGKKLFGK